MDPNIRFYDNDTTNWSGDMEQHSSSIKFIEVDNSTPNVFISSIPIVGKPTIANKNKTYNQAYINAFASQGNTYAQFLDNLINSGSPDGLKILKKDYPNNGFEPYIPELMSWAQTNNYGNKCVIFDWDKTITAVEGMYFGEHAGESIINHDVMQIALFVMGGPDRLSNVQKAIADLRSMDIQIFIITHNQNASLREASRRIYLELISFIFGIPPDDANKILYCSKDYGFAKWKSACFIDILRPQLQKCPADPNSLKMYTGKLTATQNPNEDRDANPISKRQATTGQDEMMPAIMGYAKIEPAAQMVTASETENNPFSLPPITSVASSTAPVRPKRSTRSIGKKGGSKKRMYKTNKKKTNKKKTNKKKTNKKKTNKKKTNKRYKR